jgi:hypothetical protein
VPTVEGVQLGCALECVWLSAEHLADGRRAGRQWSLRGVTVELASAGDRAFAADVERGQRVQLPTILDTGYHAVLLLDVGIGCGRLHPAEFERRTTVSIEVRQDGRGLDGGSRKT